MSKHLVRDLENLQRQILDMAGCVEESIYKSIQALQEHDKALAQEVIAGDNKIDELDNASLHRAGDADDQCDREEQADGDLVASFHALMYGAKAAAMMASSTRIETEANTTARAVERPTPSAPAPVT